MRKAYFSKKGHSLAEWSILFALIPVVFFLTQSWLKHAVQIKAQSLADYALWQNPDYGAGARDPDQFSRDINVRDKTKSTYNEYLYNKERAGTTYTGLDLNDDSLHTHSNSTVRQASFAVEQGAEAVLNTMDLNHDTVLGDFWRK